MNTAEILDYAAHHDIHLVANGGRLLVDAPKGVLTRKLTETLKFHKREILTALTSANDRHRDRNHLPDGPPNGPNVGTFDREAMDVIRAGGKVPVWSDILGEWLWWVRDEDARQRLKSEGCEVVIYTLGELGLVAGWDATALRDVHTMKKTFGANIERPERASQAGNHADEG